MEVPRDVGLDGVEPHEARLVESVGPLRGMDPEVVQPAGQEPEGFAVESESVVVDLKNGHVRWLLCSGGARVARRAWARMPVCMFA